MLDLELEQHDIKTFLHRELEENFSIQRIIKTKFKKVSLDFFFLYINHRFFKPKFQIRS
jgi:hypothetical protein